jgi:hypothetical protein
MTADKQPYVESWKVRGIREAHDQRAGQSGEVITTTLAECEEVIDRGLQYFIEVGLALIAIRDQRLYLGSYKTFEEYLKERWGLARTRAYEIMSAAHTHQAMSEISDIVPANEVQAKQLRGLEPAVAAEVMTRAKELSAGKITAAGIAKARRQVVPPPPRVKPLPRPNRGRNLSERQLYNDTLRRSAPDLLAASKGGLEWDQAWDAWKHRSRLADALHKITSLAEDPDVDLDWVLNAPLVESGKNLSTEGIATAIQFLLKAESHGLTPEGDNHLSARSEVRRGGHFPEVVRGYLGMVERKLVGTDGKIWYFRDDQGVQEAGQFANALRDLAAAVEEWAEGEA